MSEESIQATMWQWKGTLRSLNQELNEVEGILSINEPAYAHISGHGEVYIQLNQLIRTLTNHRLDLVRQVAEAEKKVAECEANLKPAPKRGKK